MIKIIDKIQYLRPTSSDVFDSSGYLNESIKDMIQSAQKALIRNYGSLNTAKEQAVITFTGSVNKNNDMKFSWKVEADKKLKDEISDIIHKGL